MLLIEGDDTHAPTHVTKVRPSPSKERDKMQRMADALVLFGATGDLARKKLFPAIYQLFAHHEIDVPVIGVARSEWDVATLREYAADAVRSTLKHPDEQVLSCMTSRLDYVCGDYGDVGTHQQLADKLTDCALPVIYLAVPPSIFPTVIDGLSNSGLAARSRVVVEKPFGRNLATAMELNNVLSSAFHQKDIFRIDHYLGKESVEGLLAFRFANTMLEPVWNRRYVKSVQVTLAEGFGTEGRAGFFDQVGTVRDVLQNHVLQTVALLAMEPPISDDADSYRDEEVRVLRQCLPLDPATTVLGQYVGYLDEDGVKPESSTETFVATTLWIDSWRWAGVPFYLRAGKYMPGAATEAVIELHRPPRLLFGGEGAGKPAANRLHFRLGHSDGVTFSMQAKVPGPEMVTKEVELKVDFASALGYRREAYERLLEDAMMGLRHRFAREDTIAEEWRIVDPIIDAEARPLPYYKKTWGPGTAQKLTGPEGWHPVSVKE